MASSYARRRDHLYAAPPRATISRAATCGGCGRTVPAIDGLGSYVCACGKAHYADPNADPSRAG